jgi:hypothetical protein
MSMVQSFHRVTDLQIQDLLNATDRNAALDVFFEKVVDKNPADGLSIGRFWHALHFLFTGLDCGGDPPLDFLLFGATRGVVIADPKIEPVHAFFSDEVKNIAAALRQWIPAEFRRRFVPSQMAAMAMADVYPREFWSACGREVSQRDVSEGDIVHVYATTFEPNAPLTEADYQYIAGHFEWIRNAIFVAFEELKAFMIKSAKLDRGVVSYRH